MTGPETTKFWVPGNPAPQGSKRHVGNGRMIEVAKGHKAWRAAVHAAAHQEAEKIGRFEDGPLSLDIVFHLEHGQQRARTPWKRLDLDKLVRAVGDALKTGGLIVDDSRIIHLTAIKYWAVGEPGAAITIRRKDLYA